MKKLKGRFSFAIFSPHFHGSAPREKCADIIMYTGFIHFRTGDATVSTASRNHSSKDGASSRDGPKRDGRDGRTDGRHRHAGGRPPKGDKKGERTRDEETKPKKGSHASTASFYSFVCCLSLEISVIFIIIIDEHCTQ